MGINREEIEEALADGKTPIELAEELGLDIESLMLERIQQLVSEGKITQEQADQRIERIQERGGFDFRREGKFRPHRTFNDWD